MQAVAIISDSIAKHVDHIDFAEVWAYPGAHVHSLTAKIRHSLIPVGQFDILIFHVGTNDIHTLSPKDLLVEFSDLISATRELSHARIAISSILPRPVDFDLTGSKIKGINKEIEALCKRRHLHFISSYRRFFAYGLPIRSMFAIRDGGLHLNFEETRQLRHCFINTISHLNKSVT